MVIQVTFGMGGVSSISGKSKAIWWPPKGGHRFKPPHLTNLAGQSGSRTEMYLHVNKHDVNDAFIAWYIVVNDWSESVQIMASHWIRHRPLSNLMSMMTSWKGNIFRVTGHLCGEFTGDQWRGALMFSLICVGVNNRKARDLGRHLAHYNVSVMLCSLSIGRLDWLNSVLTRDIW